MAAIGLDLSNLFVWGWMILMQCIHIFNMHEIAWIWNCIHKHHVSIWHYINVHVCFMHISMNLRYSTRLRGQKRKYSEGSTLWLSRSICAPQNSSGFHLFIPCRSLTSRSFMYVFSQGVCWRECFMMVTFFSEDSFNSFTSMIPPWLRHDAPRYPCSYNGRVLTQRESGLRGGKFFLE